jgi:methyl coenzyme M reductase subunit C-like uncharacterized protein (methanogenesis marker protein 7)
MTITKLQILNEKLLKYIDDYRKNYDMDKKITLSIKIGVVMRELEELYQDITKWIEPHPILPDSAAEYYALQNTRKNYSK